MESEKEFKEELKATLPLYKIAGGVILFLIILGIIVALITERKAPPPQPVVAQITPPPVQENITVNLTETHPNLTITNMTNATITQNVTNLTINATNVTPVPTMAPTLPVAYNYTWDGITVTFPSSMKRISHTITSHHYINLREIDNTPISNDEQFKLLFKIDDHKGRESEVIPTYEKEQWLISLLLPNPGNYTLIVDISCEDKKGHCQRFYPEGNIQKSTEFEV